MIYITPRRTEILAAAEGLHASLRELEPEVQEEMEKQIYLKFVQGGPMRWKWTWIWDHLIDAVSIYNPDGWRLVGDFIKDNEVFLFFNESDERAATCAFQFPDGSQLAPVLGECSAFEFYLTNASIDYMLCHNHHDYLIATGSAVDWLRSLEASSD